MAQIASPASLWLWKFGAHLWRQVRRFAWALALAALVYYPLGMWWVNVVDDDPSFALADNATPENSSRAVAMAAALIERETDVHRWVANDPFFFPGSALDNMPNFQQGIIAALGRFAFELTDQIGRTRGSSQADRDLQEAAGLLQYSGTKWIFDFSTSIAPTATSEAQYRKARRALLAYNERLAKGQAAFERRADNLLSTLDRIALDLGSSSAAIDRQIAEHSGSLIDPKADDIFYFVKGQAYGYALVLRELQRDYANVARERELGSAWTQMLASMERAATLHPWVIVNGDPDGQFLPSHLAAQGFYVLRARTQLREITAILQK